jgi:hypothetical protein
MLVMDPLVINPANVSTIVMDPLTITGVSPITLATVLILGVLLAETAALMLAAIGLVIRDVVGQYVGQGTADVLVAPKPIKVNPNLGEAYFPCYFSLKEPCFGEMHPIHWTQYIPEAQA